MTTPSALVLSLPDDGWRLIEAAARAEYDWDAQKSGGFGPEGETYDWTTETGLVKELYLDRARGWFRPVFRHLQEAMERDRDPDITHISESR